MASNTELTKVLVIGAGKVGRLVARLLADSGDYMVTAADHSEERAVAATKTRSGEPVKNLGSLVLDITDGVALADALGATDYVLSCAPFSFTLAIARAAKKSGVAYLDLTEDVATTKAVLDLAEPNAPVLIPQCGLAPGFISIVSADLAGGFDSLDEVKMRVGALPIYPHNRFKYNLTWSTEGLINEYAEPCEAVVDGDLVTTQPLEALESLSIDGTEYEAFNTSGGLGTLAESWAGKVRQLNYKSVRYPGHRDVIAFLMRDLKFSEDRETLCRVMERSVPYTHQDVVIIFVTVSGQKDGKYAQVSYVNKIYNGEIGGEKWSAIQLTTASSLCAVLDLCVAGKIPTTGFIRQEEIPFDLFIANRFAKPYVV